ncbi:hypothetical protein LTR84_008900 [Exophiala bonariae]|uniref:Uncharacterized protein n=1 Tax=Exophiala bonariae TaxID=1690606 RepID=A0AAV9MX03_9EURO|nr:hypothetical protein LTR84_008900 [Exophiala bonariae]
MAAPYSPTTPTPPWPSPSTVNQHRSNLTNKRKVDAIVDTNDIDSVSNSSISSQFKKLRLNQQRHGILNPNLNINANNGNFNAHHQNGDLHMQSQLHYQQILTPTSPTSKYRPHIANTDVRPALPPLPPDPTLRRQPSPSLLPSPTLASPRTPTPTARTTRGPTALASSYRRLHDPPAARELPLSPPEPSPRQNSHTRNSSIASSIMAIDETPNRIIINDLEAEIAAIEAAEAEGRNTVFIPDIDKKVSAIPQRLLQNSSNAPVSNDPSAGPGSSAFTFPPNPHSHSHHHPSTTGAHAFPTPSTTPPLATALVLYKDPTSISVPESEDVVRKTIIAARQRAREKAMEDQRDRDRERQVFLSEYRSPGKGQASSLFEQHRGDPDFFDDAMTDHSSVAGDFDDDLDPDAMDIE